MKKNLTPKYHIRDAPSVKLGISIPSREIVGAEITDGYILHYVGYPDDKWYELYASFHRISDFSKIELR